MESMRHSRIDKSGAIYEIGLCGIHDLSSLLDMYAVFSPKPASQGLPPADQGVCGKWIKELLETGENLAATKENRIIGHGALIPDLKGHSAEFVIFVHQAFRNLGIGSELSAAALQRARDLGFTSVWLTVAVTNFIAIKLYRKLGFQYLDMDDCERIMAIGF